MEIRLYVVFDLSEINTYGTSPMDVCRVMNEKELRELFYTAYENGGLPYDLIDDYHRDDDYKNEDWNDLGNLRIGTVIDMLNDIVNYSCGDGFYIVETDVEIGD